MAGAVLRARTDVEESEKVEFKINAQSSIKEGQLLHRLAARSLIKYIPPPFFHFHFHLLFIFLIINSFIYL
jgi:hypothetical protein